MDNYEDVIAEWLDQLEVDIDNTLQTMVLLIGKNLVTLSPVDTGRFKGNWQMSIGALSTSSMLRYDQDGAETLADIARVSNKFTAGQIAYIQNNVLYGYDLEYGSSAQAPDGMVRVTEARFLTILNEAMRLTV